MQCQNTDVSSEESREIHTSHWKKMKRTKKKNQTCERVNVYVCEQHVICFYNRKPNGSRDTNLYKYRAKLKLLQNISDVKTLMLANIRVVYIYIYMFILWTKRQYVNASCQRIAIFFFFTSGDLNTVRIYPNSGNVVNRLNGVDCKRCEL